MGAALALALAVTVTVTACAGARDASPAAAFALLPPEQRPISVVLPTDHGGHLDVSDYRGRALLVLAFTTDNLLSQALLRNLEALAHAHREDLAVVAMAGDPMTREEGESLVRTYAEVLNLHDVVMALATDEVREGDSALGRIERSPTLFLVNRAGVIARHVEGYLSRAQLEALVAPALPARR